MLTRNVSALFGWDDLGVKYRLSSSPLGLIKGAIAAAINNQNYIKTESKSYPGFAAFNKSIAGDVLCEQEKELTQEQVDAFKTQRDFWWEQGENVFNPAYWLMAILNVIKTGFAKLFTFRASPDTKLGYKTHAPSFMQGACECAYWLLTLPLRLLMLPANILHRGFEILTHWDKANNWERAGAIVGIAVIGAGMVLAGLHLPVVLGFCAKAATAGLAKCSIALSHHAAVVASKACLFFAAAAAAVKTVAGSVRTACSWFAAKCKSITVDDLISHPYASNDHGKHQNKQSDSKDQDNADQQPSIAGIDAKHAFTKKTDEIINGVKVRQRAPDAAKFINAVKHATEINEWREHKGNKHGGVVKLACE